MIGFPEAIRDTLRRVRAGLPGEVSIHLAGGAVRDIMLGRTTNDLDFVLTGDVLALTRRLGNKLGAAYYPLDEERKTARLVQIWSDGTRQKLDFSALRGATLDEDLQARDFTINAMALTLDEQPRLVDPLGGAADLKARVLRACSDQVFIADPVRVVRSVRLATDLECKIRPETTRLIRQAVPLLANVSAERLRDELFRMLDGSSPATAIRLLDMLGALEAILPEVVALKGVSQSPPHIYDVWSHTLEVVQRLNQILAVLAVDYDQEKAANWALGFVSVELGRYRQQINEHLNAALNPDRSLRGLLILAGLYHDVGKPGTQIQDETGRIRFFEHEQAGAELAVGRARALRLSGDEMDRLATIVYNHMRPHLLAQAGASPSRRAIYRFFRAAGAAGVDICLLSLADSLATYGPTMPQETWARQLSVARNLLNAWWEYPEQAVRPPALVNGNDLIQVFDLESGPLIGQILDEIREAQATGQVNTREQALCLAGKKIEQAKKD